MEYFIELKDVLALEACFELQYLNISNCYKLTTLGVFRKLIYLNISNCISIKNLEVLLEFRSLKILVITYNNKIFDELKRRGVRIMVVEGR